MNEINGHTDNSEQLHGVKMIKYCKIIWLLLLLLVMSCSSHKIVKEGGAEKGIVDKKETASPTSSFILGSGDEITFNVWRHEDLKRKRSWGRPLDYWFTVVF